MLIDFDADDDVPGLYDDQARVVDRLTDDDDDAGGQPLTGDVDLGPCCCCGEAGPTVRNLVTLPRRAPVPGTGWGCLVCKLPADGAYYVACDRCVREGASPLQVVAGYALAKGRAPISTLSDGPFDHDLSRHPGEGVR